jgi:hypothetical protein
MALLSQKIFNSMLCQYQAVRQLSLLRLHAENTETSETVEL